MIYNQEEAYRYLLKELNERPVRYSVHEFRSGAKMIDIWLGGLFYVVQIEQDFVGISLINDENPGFDVRPDLKFFSVEEFVVKLQSIF